MSPSSNHFVKSKQWFGINDNASLFIIVFIWIAWDIIFLLLQLNFIGVTVEPDRRYIHFPSNKHMFVPVPVGEKTSPTQIYELYNGGAVPVVYDFNTTPLEIIKQVS